MPPKRKTTDDSDDEYRAPSVPKRARAKKQPDTFFQTSSAPTSPRIDTQTQHTPQEDESDFDDDIAPLPDLFSQILAGASGPGPSTQPQNVTPRKQTRRANSESPGQFPSPATSTIFEPSPEKPRGGRPRVSKANRNSRKSQGSSAAEQEQKRELAKAKTRLKDLQRKAEKAAIAAEERRKEAPRQAEEEKARKRVKAQEYVEKLTAPEENGGAGFESFMEFFNTLIEPGSDAQASANLTRFLKTNGKHIIEGIVARVPSVGEEFIDQEFDSKLDKVLRDEGVAIQKLLSRDWTVDVMTLLKEFSIEQLTEQLMAVAPTLWRILERVTTASASTRRKSQGLHVRMCYAQCIAFAEGEQLPSRYWTLLASGSSKREMEVLAHAGLSTSYNTIKKHIHKLSEEGIARFRQLIKDQMCFIVWDNLNIAFRVESQRLNSANHFDNGTTATVIPVHNPFTGGTTPHGTLPLSMKPPRTSTHPIVDWNCDDVLPTPESAEQLAQCCLWQIKWLAVQNIANLEHLKAAFEECPEVDPIALHKTDQYPLPAMHEDESSIEGTIRVYVQILRNLGVTNDDLRKHGLLFDDGDLLTDSLIDKIESARCNSDQPIEGMKAAIRRFGLFHAKMAGCRLVLNEHWGKPNSLWPGSLWWEHTTLLKRKPLSAGWKAKKATPWKPSHELLQISMAAHVKDGFRIHCGEADLDGWAASATKADFDAVADRVYRELFTTEGLDNLRSKLLNRDGILYIEFVSAIKKGDIGRVVNVLSVWMVMMRAPKTMPKYADAIFETLRRIDRYDPILKRFFLHNWLVNLTGRAYGFKEVDLLQEHQNFWAKMSSLSVSQIIYNAKGSNKSWDWLSMITVCIFTLRDTMRTVQKAFKIPALGESHKVPDMSAEIQQLADALRDERLQEYVPNRPANGPSDSTAVTPVRDLLEEGAKYADTRGAFKKFTKEERRAQNLGFVDAVHDASGGVDSDGEESETEEQYVVTQEDLELDDEEPYADAPSLLAAAEELISNV
ncbi:hypothetical protein FB451DRAFT_1443579 [Mycena latifolia]|nr:hypothetical protein FB451DRAFT_1443579 [Mycena latifolia]